MTATSHTATGTTTSVALIVGAVVAALALFAFVALTFTDSRGGNDSTNSLSSYTTDIQDASGAGAYLDNLEVQH